MNNITTSSATTTATASNEITDEQFDQFIIDKKLDFEVKTVSTPVAQEILDINPEAKSNQFQIYRTDNGKIFHSGMSNQYHPIQNREALSFIKDLAKTTDQPIKLVSGGIWKGGAQTFASIKLGSASVGRNNGDIIEQNVTFMNSHNGTYSMRIVLTPFRLFCANQISTVNSIMAKGGSEISFKIRHSEGAIIKMEELRQQLKIINHEFVNTVDVYNQLEMTVSSEDYVEAILNDIFPNTDKFGKNVPREGTAKNNFDLRVADARARFNHADGGRIQQKTAWNLYNAVQGSIQHAPVRLLQANAKILSASNVKDFISGEASLNAFESLDRTESILVGAIARDSRKALDSVMRIAPSQSMAY